MRDAYRSLLTALGAVLALWLILGFWPLSTGSRGTQPAGCSGVRGDVLASASGFSGAGDRCPGDCDENLPPEDFQGAVILVCGDNPLFVSGFTGKPDRAGICG
jgi:hypothetical protein